MLSLAAPLLDHESRMRGAVAYLTKTSPLGPHTHSAHDTRDDRAIVPLVIGATHMQSEWRGTSSLHNSRQHLGLHA